MTKREKHDKTRHDLSAVFTLNSEVIDIICFLQQQLHNLSVAQCTRHVKSATSNTQLLTLYKHTHTHTHTEVGQILQIYGLVIK